MRMIFARELEQAGSIFQTTSDTEVVVHLIAQSKEQTLPDAIADALRRIEGAFSLVMMTRDRIFAARIRGAFVHYRWDAFRKAASAQTLSSSHPRPAPSI